MKKKRRYNYRQKDKAKYSAGHNSRAHIITPKQWKARLEKDKGKPDIPA